MENRVRYLLKPYGADEIFNFLKIYNSLKISSDPVFIFLWFNGLRFNFRIAIENFDR